jgi:ABC-2 type transport system ATP-binding protein
VRVLKDRIRLERSRGTTVLLSTHVIELAEEVSTSLAIIHRGRLAYADPMSQAVARAREGGRTLEGLFLDLTGG